ncbi:unnamed protein product [Schistosoma margrebowiei]|uniref:Uncharacterized protein n=1 Tax=Schistosoma margrebowiei TaxID=48269 RepID=A0A183LY75_9TREM|nr:unnamed protein product [Schistosoma margrebowiei]
MVVEGSHQETLDTGFVLFGTRLPVILSELVYPDGFDPVSPSSTVVVRNSRQETLDSGSLQSDTRRQGMFVMLINMMISGSSNLGYLTLALLMETLDS